MSGTVRSIAGALICSLVLERTGTAWRMQYNGSAGFAWSRLPGWTTCIMLMEQRPGQPLHTCIAAVGFV
jgi:hypothetical protein